jgi:hypothetical protein
MKHIKIVRYRRPVWLFGMRIETSTFTLTEAQGEQWPAGEWSDLSVDLAFGKLGIIWMQSRWKKGIQNT